MSALNNFTKAYANLDIQDGVFALDGQLSAQESDETGDISGRFTPIVTNVNVLRWQDDAERQGDPGVILAWEGTAGAIAWLLEVGRTDKMTTNIPASGSIENPDVSVIAGAWGLVKNALYSTSSSGKGGNESE